MKTQTKPVNSVDDFAKAFAVMTGHSDHSYEAAVHSLLGELAEYRRQDALSAGEYETIIGTAADVMRHFSLTLETLEKSESWYRASVVHQMGQGMLQSIRVMREDLTMDAPYQEALSGLAIGKRAAAHLSRAESPLEPVTCRRWAKERARPSCRSEELKNRSGRFSLTF